MTPKILHRIWFGDQIPDEYVAYGERLAELHPGWEIRDWRDTDRLDLRCQELYDQAPDLVPDDWQRFRSDVLRLEILHQFGGVYLDMDMEPVKPLDALVDDRAFAGWETQDRWIGSAVIGAPPGDPFIGRLLDGLEANMRQHLGGSTSLLSGPRYLTSVYRRFPDELTVRDQDLFYPYSFNELDRADEEFPDAYLIHRWANRRAGRDSRGRRR